VRSSLRCLYVCIALTLSGQCLGSDAPSLKIEAPYVDLRTGPGIGFPVTHVVERGEYIEAIKIRTDWVKISTQDRFSPKTGWIHRDELSGATYENGDVADFSLPDRDELSSNRWVVTGTGGDFDGADSLSLSLGYRMTANLTAEARIGRAVGDFSDSEFGYFSLTSQPFPTWRWTPFFELGAGVITTSPNTQLVQTEDRTDNAMLVGAGVQTYISRNFTLRLKYNQHLVLTNREVNEDVNEWQLGFAVSF